MMRFGANRTIELALVYNLFMDALTEIPRVGGEMELEITDVAYRGSGIARREGVVVFVPGTLPEEVAKVRITGSGKRFLTGEVLEILKPSPDRIAPCCRLADGTHVPGCVYDHAAYSAEVALKDAQLRNFLRKLVTDNEGVFLPPAPSPLPLHYRNKAVFHVQNGPDGALRAGYLGDDNRTVIDIPSCPLADEAINAAWAQLRAEGKLHDGDSVTFRHTKADGVVSWIGRPSEKARWLTEDSGVGPVLVPLDGFFQVNPPVADALVADVRAWVAEAARETGATRLLDLYCGVGVFGLAAARDGIAEVVGVESGRNAVAAARRNARNLGTTHATFHCETAAEAARKDFHCADLSRTIAVVDPPRSGMERAAAEALAKAGPPAIVYVSCDPATLTRDLGIFTAHGYAVRRARVFDMFPRTLHFESAVLLCR
jgi:tRNA/tmRNA/rRNA uracil-C5-methylase (TrmA/RlmC/RlmD family)